ncbi:tail fiber domain-containing protein [Emticicia agri]|uniref:Tail fiber domain-containing protein n=1 Tax=Emticicia agri TaxID=2492393 RepID=A0A4V1ZCK5_9BACT|nr:tail fiber domain-containing protein [Emticicia agri]RYU92980.1 tail fiber domain-containing protein [Emticicia agri]
MKKQVLLISLIMSTASLTFAQSATINPDNITVSNPSPDPHSYAIRGVVSSPTNGLKSAAIRGENLGTDFGGFGIWGAHSGGGTGIYGQSVKGIGVVGESGTLYGVKAFSESGIGLYANSGSGHAGYFLSMSGNTKEVIYVQNLGLGGGMEINTILPYNTKDALKVIAQGTGAGINVTGFNSDGDGAGLVVGKKIPYQMAFTTDPKVDLDVRHPMGDTEGMSGLRILNTGPNLSNWTMYAANGTGDLLFYCKGVLRGSIDAATGAYTAISDKRLKTNIKDYNSILADVMKMEVKSYQRLNSAKTEIGLMAQDALKYFPEIVYDNTNDKGEQFYTMDYSRIGVIAIKAIQEQQKEIDLLKNEIAELKKLIKK